MANSFEKRIMHKETVDKHPYKLNQEPRFRRTKGEWGCLWGVGVEILMGIGF